MSKKDTKTSGKVVTKRPAAKKTKPVTMAERVRRIEDTVKKIEREVSLIRSGASFMRELEQAKPTEEHGLEPGDYTDASKKVADELTAMGYNWIDEDRARLRYIEWGSYIEHQGLMVNKNGTGLAPLSQDTMLSRARVTAKRLGLAPKPRKPEVGQYVKPSPKAMDGWVLCPPESGVIERIDGSLLFVREMNGVLRNGIESWRYEPMSPEEVAAYKEQQELAKPIVFGTKVKMAGGEWVIVSHKPDRYGYSLNRATDGDDEWRHNVKRHEFTVLP